MEDEEDKGGFADGQTEKQTFVIEKGKKTSVTFDPPLRAFSTA